MSLQAHIEKAKSDGSITNGFPYYRVPNTQYILSIQAGCYKYSEPRENYPNLADYESVELAIFKGDDKDWFNVQDELPAIAELAGFEFGDCPVAGYVPLDDVLKIEALLQSSFLEVE